VLARAARRSLSSRCNNNNCNFNVSILGGAFNNNSRWFASYPPHEVVGMPSLSPTMESGSISAWNLEEGASFNAGDVICSVETDKATVDFEAQDDGVVAKIIVAAGSGEIPCGTPIMVTVEDAADVPSFKDFVVGAAAASDVAAPAAKEAAPAPTPIAAPTPAAPAAAPAATAPTGERVVASPRAHTIAKERGYGEISALRIVGTGPGGRIIAQDVLDYDPSSAPAPVVAETIAAAAAATPAAAAPVAAAAAPAVSTSPLPEPVKGPGYTDYSLPAAAMELASRLHTSKKNVPHYYLSIDLSLDSLMELRSSLNSTMKLEENDGGISVNDLLMKAAAAAMKTVPAANASWMDSFVRVYDSVDINLVVGNGSSLYAPVIRDVGRRGLKAVSDDVATATSVVEGSDPTTVPGFGDVGTFTMVNLGMFGVKSAAPIIREPQACALALGVIENRIVPNDDAKSEEIYKESVMMTATLSCDHRVVDGAVGAQWLSAFKNHVENPVTLLL
jgi:pyruvate dehydrogenase E2 component (dihydrolipoamide acetyltransferase)